MQTVEETYYTLPEVAERLKVSRRTVYRWVQAGDLSAYKLGGEFRITKRDLEHFLEPRRTVVRREPAKGELYVHRPVVVDGRALKQLRQYRGLSVRELTEQANVSSSVIYRLEKGRLRQSWAEMHTVRKLAQALNVEAEELIKGGGDA
jgi:excisionase family DNA binding protein